MRELLEQISGFDNVPRKKAKFQVWICCAFPVWRGCVAHWCLSVRAPVKMIKWVFSFCSSQNWMKNSLKVHNESVLEQVWNIFAEASSNVSQIEFYICSVAKVISNNEMRMLFFGGQDSLLFQRASLCLHLWERINWMHCREDFLIVQREVFNPNVW